MKSFLQYIIEGNRQGRELAKAERAYRVDTRPSGTDSFGLGRYWSSPSGSGTYRGGDLGPDQTLSPPISFGTPGGPNALYAFPRRDANGNIVPAMAVYGQSGRGTIYTTPAGLETLRKSQLYVHSASAETFTPSDRVLAYGDPAEVVSQSTPVDIRTSRVKDPEGFVRSQHDIVVLPHEDDIRKKFAEHQKNPNPDLSVTISIGDECGTIPPAHGNPD